MSRLFINKDWTTLKKLLFMNAASGGSLTEYTATGNPATFSTNVAKPLNQLLIPFTPVQSGSGDPSPENVRPITGWTGVTAAQFGSNVYDSEGNTEGKFINIIGGFQTSDPWQITDFISVDGSTYIIYDGITTPGTSPYSAWYRDGESLISTFKQQTGKNVLAVPSGAKYVRFSLYKSGATDDVDSFTLIPSAHSYTVTFPDGQTIYGGTLDIDTGVLSVDMATIDLGSLGWAYGGGNGSIWHVSSTLTPQLKAVAQNQLANAYCDKLLVSAYNSFSHDSQKDMRIAIDSNGKPRIRYNAYNLESITEFKAFLSTATFMAELATPLEYQLTPTEINSLIGDNTVWSDTNGTNTVKYLKKG